MIVFRYISDHWQGKWPLWHSLYINALLIGTAINIVFDYIFGTNWLLGQGEDLKQVPLGVIIFNYVFAVWAVVGVWRSASIEAHEPGTYLFPRLVQGGLIFSVAVFVYDALQKADIFVVN